MRIFVAGATGVLGRATLPNLDRHDVLGLTRTPEKLPLLRELGAEGVVCDVYDAAALTRVAQNWSPDVVVNFVTDLSAGSSEANNRVRREGGMNLVSAAEAAGSRRLVLESVAFPLERPAAEALEQMEQPALRSPLEVLILRFGRLWGPATLYKEPPEPPAIHVDDAGTRAAALITSGRPGTYVIASDARLRAAAVTTSGTDDDPANFSYLATPGPGDSDGGDVYSSRSCSN
jgi:nucleoside-diphosphate-sugar epimerase